MQKSRSGRSSTGKAVVLSIALFIGLAFYYVLNRHGLPTDIVNVFDERYQATKLQEFSDSVKNQYHTKIAGFWVADDASASENSGKKVSRYDHLEIRDNGIIWQVVELNLVLPNGDTKRVGWTRNGFLRPYAHAVDNKREILTETRIFRQTFYTETDTCYGENQVDEIWRFALADSALRINDVEYKQYSGAIAQFFPDSVIDLVDALLPNACKRGDNMGSIAERLLREQIGSMVALDSAALNDYLRDYYNPLVIRPLFPNVDSAMSVALVFKLSANGEIRELNIQGDLNPEAEGRLRQRTLSWPIPRLTTEGPFRYIVNPPR